MREMVTEATPEAVERAAALLRGGGVVAFPTETVYGLGADALNAVAVARVFEIKGRPTFDPLIVHVVDEAMLARVASRVSERARRAMERFWPGPLTLILPKGDAVPELVTAGLPTVAVRMPAHPVARDLIARAATPLAAPSANPFGYVSPTRAEHVEQTLAQRVDCILDAGPSSHGLESTIVVLDPHPTVLRYGALPVEELEAEFGPFARDLFEGPTPLSPGRLPRHYSPRTPLRVIEPRLVPPGARAASAALCFTQPDGSAVEGYACVRVLSESGDLREAAARLFETLHELDALELTRIDAQPVPDRDLGRAILDRLRRASAR